MTHRSNLARHRSRKAESEPTSTRGTWKLQDAKAHFSEVVRAARTHGPQRVTIRGESAAVVISVEDYARLAPLAAQPSLHALLSNSPLRDLEFGEEGVRAPVRDVVL
jgi:prevent-host-death family protein